MAKKINLKAVVEKLKDFYQKQERPPSYEEIRKLFQYKSKNSAYWLVTQLVEAKVLRRDSGGKLIWNLPNGIPLLGSVQAGFPSPAEEELVDILNLDQFLIQHPDQTYLIKVNGDSMKDAGIHEGDLVLVERGREAHDRDIVIAQVDGEWTMKYYEKIGQAISLIPANKNYATIHPKHELLIGGVVTGVIRKYK